MGWNSEPVLRLGGDRWRTLDASDARETWPPHLQPQQRQLQLQLRRLHTQRSVQKRRPLQQPQPSRSDTLVRLSTQTAAPHSSMRAAGSRKHVDAGCPLQFQHSMADLLLVPRRPDWLVVAVVGSVAKIVAHFLDTRGSAPGDYCLATRSESTAAAAPPVAVAVRLFDHVVERRRTGRPAVLRPRFASAAPATRSRSGCPRCRTLRSAPRCRRLADHPGAEPASPVAVASLVAPG